MEEKNSLLPQTVNDTLLGTQKSKASRLANKVEEILVGKKGGTRGSAFSLGVSMIGIGLLTLPRVFGENGIILGTLLIVGIGAFMGLTCYMLMVAEDYTGESSMERIITSLLGKKGGVFLDMILCVLMVAIMCAKLEIIASALHNLLSFIMHDEMTQKGFRSHEFSLALAVALVIPLALIPTVTKLRFSSTLGVYALTTVVLCVVFHGFKKLFTDGVSNVLDEAPMFNFSSNTITTIPLVIFSFGSHPQATEVFHELTTPSLGRMRKVIIGAQVLAGILYCFMGAFGVLSFPTAKDISGDILSQFDSDDITTTIARIAMSLEVICSFPLLMMPARSTLYHFIQVVFGMNIETSKPRLSLHIGLTLLLGAVAYVLAMKAQSLESILGLAGGTCGSMIVFVFPAVLYALSVKTTPFKAILCIFVGGVGVAVILSKLLM
eukprot:TRINITY_DN2622_c0_g1_i1.p1 TRINITY_DN2622_c0_g1~~TRINITY_DN2622_c0_g1_i1.p1  ORF type:complete len:436 (+),score=125.36 TRINITY_DN2622_c0_g1_i1:1908-3215(+)